MLRKVISEYCRAVLCVVITPPGLLITLPVITLVMVVSFCHLVYSVSQQEGEFQIPSVLVVSPLATVAVPRTIGTSSSFGSVCEESFTAVIHWCVTPLAGGVVPSVPHVMSNFNNGRHNHHHNYHRRHDCRRRHLPQESLEAVVFCVTFNSLLKFGVRARGPLAGARDRQCREQSVTVGS